MGKWVCASIESAQDGTSNQVDTFELKPVSTHSGEFAAMWFDDESRTWNDVRLGKVERLAGQWQSRTLQLHREARRITPVLYNPNALAVTEAIRNKLSIFKEVEFLPIRIAGHGEYYILHVLANIDIPEKAEIQRAPPIVGNVVRLTSFPRDFSSMHAFFRLRQPPDSPAGRKGFCMHTIYLNGTGRDAIESSCGDFLGTKAL